MAAVHIPGITAPPSTAYKIVDVAENYREVIAASWLARHLRRPVDGRESVGAVR